MSVTVSGLRGQMALLNGMYTLTGKENHGRPVYSRKCESHESKNSSIYYWDERDGEQMQGWWMAPIVGGEEVWAHAEGNDRNPPMSGWKVPWNEKIDPQVKFVHSSNSNFNPGSVKKVLPPIDFSEFADEKKTETTTTENKKSAVTVLRPDNMPPKGKGKGGKGEEKGKGKGEEKGKGKGKGEERGKGKGKGEERGKGKGKGEEMGKGTNDVHVRRLDEVKGKGKGKGDDKGKGKGKGAEKGKGKGKDTSLDLEKKKIINEEMLKKKAEDAKKVEAALKEKMVRWRTEVNEVQETMKEIEKLVEEYRDVTAVLTSDVADHLSPDDTIEAFEEGMKVKEKLDKPREEVQNIMKTMGNDALFQKCDTDFKNDYANIKKDYQKFFSQFKDLHGVCKKYYSKAQQEKEKEKIIEKQKAEEEKLQKLKEWNRDIVGEVAEYCIIGQLTAKRAQAEESQLDEAEVSLKRAKFVIEEAIKKEGALPGTINELKNLNRHNKRMYDEIAKVTKRRKLDVEQKVSSTIFDLLGKFRAQRQEGVDLFDKFAPDGELNLEGYKKMLTSLEMEGMDNHFHQCLKRAGKETSLSKTDFHLFCEFQFKRAVEGAVFTLADSEKVEKLEKDEVINVINYVTVNDEKKMEVMRMKDEMKGFVPIQLQNGSESLAPYSPKYKCVTETVMTDKSELKGFKVVLRLKPGDIFTATEVPIANKVSKLLRIHGVSGKSNGFTTIKGSQGTSYLETIPPEGEKEKEDEKLEEEKVEKLTDEERAAILNTMKDENDEELSGLMKAAEETLEKYDSKTVEMTVMCDTGPKLEDIEEFRNEVSELGTMAQNKLTLLKVFIVSCSRKVGKCRRGPLGDLVNTLQSLPEKVNMMQDQITDLGLKITQQIDHLRRAELERQKQEKIEQGKEKIVALKEEMEQYENDVTNECCTAEMVIESIGDDHEELELAVSACTQTLTKIKTWMDENVNLWKTEYDGVPEMREFCKGEFQQFRAKMLQIRARMKDVRTKKIELQKKLEEKHKLGLGLQFLRYLKEKEQTSDELFHNGDDVNTLSLEEFLKRAEVAGLKVPKSILETNYYLNSIDGMTKEQFAFLCTPRMICCKSTSLTDILEIKTSKSILTIPVNDVVDIIGEPEEDKLAKVNRVRVQKVVPSGDETKTLEGYITLKGLSSGTAFFQQYKPYFKVVKPTVLTSLKAMKGFKVIGQLKLGDYIFASGLPEKETELLRIECSRLEDPSVIGWCTIQNSTGVYLENVDMKASQVNEIIAQKKPKVIEVAKVDEAVVEEVKSKNEKEEPLEDVEMTPAEETTESVGSLLEEIPTPLPEESSDVVMESTE